MKRKDWTFTLPVQTVLEAAKAKYDFHKGRVAYWSKLYEENKKEYKESGFVVDDAFGASNTTYRQVHVEFNESSQRKMEEAKAKLIEHEAKAEEYGAFASALGATSAPGFGAFVHTTELALNCDDIIYFGLGAKIDEEAEEAVEAAG